MLSPISTSALYGALRANIGATQTQEATATAQMSSQKVAQDLAGYGAGAGALTAMNSLSTRLTQYANNAEALSGQLGVQDQALTTLNTAVQAAKSAVSEAVGNNSGDDLMTTLQSALTSAAGALNTQYNGQYLFAGGQGGTQPVAAAKLSDLAAASPVSSVFQNGPLKASNRLDDSTVVQTGVLASDAGGPLMGALQSVAAYDSGPNGPFADPLTADQQTFLSGVLGQFSTAVGSTTTIQADNGVVAQQVKAAATTLSDQQTAIAGVISNLTTPDEAQVATQLTLAQTTLQASAQIFASLQQDSLLRVLSGG